MSTLVQRQLDLFHDPVGLDQDLDDLLVVADIALARDRKRSSVRTDLKRTKPASQAERYCRKNLK